MLLGLGVTAYGQFDGLGGHRRDGMTNRRLGNRRGISPSDTSSVRRSKKRKKLKTYPLAQYRLYDWQQDTIQTDTLLDINDYHRANFTGKDLYYGQAFQNIGQPVNRLTGWPDEDLLPRWTPSGKHPVEFRKKDLLFAHVPTPLSRLYFLTGNGQGQMLHSHFHINIYPYWNVNFGYHGLSSLGYYRHSVSQDENWFINTHYTDSTRRLDIRLYMIKNILLNEENGGIVDEQFFENPGDTYLDRGKIPVRSENGKSLWHARSEGASIRWAPISAYSAWQTGYSFDYTKGYFRYEGLQADFGPSQPYSTDFDSLALRDYRHSVFGLYTNNTMEASLGWTYWRAFRRFDTSIVHNGMYIPSSTLWTEHFIDARLRYTRDSLRIAFQSQWGMQGHHSILVNGQYRLKRHTWKARLQWQHRRPEPKFLLWQSRYRKYNWAHSFDDVQVLRLHFQWNNPAGQWQAGMIRARNYTYFGTDSLPHQQAAPISVVSFTYRKDWQWKYGGIYPELTWQNLQGGGLALDLPRLRGRLTLYYKDHWFRRHMYLNAGIRITGFSAYYMPAYVPVIGEFVQQRYRHYGNYYIADVFFNFQVKKFYAFLSLEHVNAYWEKRHPNYYSAPFQPYADQTIRLGIIWKFVN